MNVPEYAQDATEAPTAWLKRWLDEAKAAGQINHTAMALSTLSASGAPRVRFVLCKGITDTGIQFFTNLESDKALEIAGDQRVAVAFYWQAVGRQVRIEGTLTPLDDATADAYFATRSRMSQIGAWASAQSRPIPTREDLLAAADEVEARFPEAVPRPPNWSGFHLHAEHWEFWVDQPGRIHDRWVLREGGSGWKIWRLQP